MRCQRSDRRYDPDFRDGAVRDRPGDGQVDRPGRRDLGINPGTLANWVADGQDGPGRAARPEARSIPSGCSQLERENAELRMERDVLKRSVVLWVKEATNR